jgi:hypothetical protein
MYALHCRSSAFVCFVWTVYNRSAIVVRAAQPFFLLILLGGIVISRARSFRCHLTMMAIRLNQFPFAVGICMSVPWLAFHFTVTFPRFQQNVACEPAAHVGEFAFSRSPFQDGCIGSFAVISHNVIVLICWTALDPLTYTR